MSDQIQDTNEQQESQELLFNSGDPVSDALNTARIRIVKHYISNTSSVEISEVDSSMVQTDPLYRLIMYGYLLRGVNEQKMILENRTPDNEDTSSQLRIQFYKNLHIVLQFIVNNYTQEEEEILGLNDLAKELFNQKRNSYLSYVKLDRKREIGSAVNNLINQKEIDFREYLRIITMDANKSFRNIEHHVDPETIEFIKIADTDIVDNMITTLSTFFAVCEILSISTQFDQRQRR